MLLQDLLSQGEAALSATSTFISMGMLPTKINCTGVETLSDIELEAFFSKIPPDWEWERLAEAIEVATLTPTLRQQLQDHIDPPAPTTEEITPQDPHSFNIFSLRDEIIKDYRNYIESFLKIRDPRVEEFVKIELDKGYLWQDPLLQINPPYKRSATITQLIQQDILHPNCDRYFPDYHFYQHQEKAFSFARQRLPFVVTTGTGSGKSLTYVVPIIDDLLRNPEIKGVRAILVYPMNALINSQEKEFQKFLEKVPHTHIRVAKYTGQESLSEKSEIQNNPPHILLTNYVMLELMLTRFHEERLVESPVLKFLVLDELHTYRGRQGADVALVIRKLKQRCSGARVEKERNNSLVCIGTSATMATGGKREERQRTVAEVASKLFGVEINPAQVIDETLERAMSRPEPSIAELQESLTKGLPPQGEFCQHPLSAWIEMNFGLAEEDGHLIRRTPISLRTGARKLSQETGIDESHCYDTLGEMFLWSSRVRQQDKKGGFPLRLHQFISQGGSVYATLESPEKRELTLDGQYKINGDRLLFPLVFCRDCGQDYYVVRYDSEQQTVTPLLPTALDEEIDSEDIQDGYLTPDEPELWDVDDRERLPNSWFKETKKRGKEVKTEYQKFIPQKLYIYPNGSICPVYSQDDPNPPQAFWFIPQPLLICLNCGIVYDRKTSEYTKLSRLSSEGRSTATTLLSLSTVNHLKNNPAIPQESAKILSFTDNRQDASLQAGHFNDFVQTSFLRASLYQALKSRGTLTHKELATTVVRQMGLSQSDYAQNPAEFNPGKKHNEQALEHLVEYRLYEDLRRGWRIVQPNLEQCGLLEIQYDSLEENCAHSALWQTHPILLQASPEQRYTATKALLDSLRKNLAIDAKLLQGEELKELKREVAQTLNERWGFEGNEWLHEAKWASLTSSNSQAEVKLTAQSVIGRYLRSARAWNWLTTPLSEAEYPELIEAMVGVLGAVGYLKREEEKIQLQVTSMVWKAQKVAAIPLDPLFNKRLSGSTHAEQSVNQYFQQFYQAPARGIKTMEGREHTGQVKNEKRQEREELFRNGKLSALYCSPTMELGIDIADLNVVHLRNVPPSPSNYAQRSGRAGRSGQEALVITYAAAGSGHDRYFYQKQEQMVAGVVFPPKLELANPDLVTSHLYSLWLAYTKVDLGNSMNQILDLALYGLPLKTDLLSALTLSPPTLERCLKDAQAILRDTFCQGDLERAAWYSSEWLQSKLDNALREFNRACDRWRRLYQNAVTQRDEAREIIDNAHRGNVPREEQEKAEALLKDAGRQLNLLVGQSSKSRSLSEFEFYPYRYLAAEGFLPGFNFPRLPVRAYIPAGEAGEFISRSRSVAIREIAPQNIVYYEGSKYRVEKTKISPTGADLKQIACCSSCGYYHDPQNFARDTCCNCGAKITDKLNAVLTMETMSARRRERITCDEEERLKSGYRITTHFRYDSPRKVTGSVIAGDGQELFRLCYGETAEIVRINRGLRRSPEPGFRLDTQTGYWGVEAANKAQTPPTLRSNVHLMVSNTTNLLLVELADDQCEDFLATLQYALERAIQTVYKLELDELTSERLGDKGNHLLFWESAEGGAGVLSQILEDPDSFQKLAAAALEICHFQTPKESCYQACYECLLSYQNQFDHAKLNRNRIRPLLELLTASTLSQEDKDTRYAHYQGLLEQTDAQSDYERLVLQAIYQEGIALPDAAQFLIEEAKCKPDFVYHDAKIAVFCDGSVHDSLEQQEKDRIQRENLKWLTNYQVFTFNYREDLVARVRELKSLL